MEQAEHTNEPNVEEESKEEEKETEATTAETKSGSTQGNETESRFECNICLDTVSEPVITFCGHLFCWPCIYEWIKAGERPCPVCKSSVAKEKLIPLYGRGVKNPTDPRIKIPERPHGQRSEPTRRGWTTGGMGGGWGGPQVTPGNFFPFPGPPGGPGFDGVAFAGGFGFFPSLFGLQFQFGTDPNRPPGPLTPQEEQQQFFSRVLLSIGLFLLFIITFG